MKAYIYSLILIMSILVFACSHKNYQGEGVYGVPHYFYVETPTPQVTLDSICKAEKIKIDPNVKWDKNQFITNDSLVYTENMYTGKLGKVLYIFSIGKYDKDKVYQFKFRKE